MDTKISQVLAQVRTLVLSGQGDAVRRLLLTRDRINVIDAVRDGHVTSEQISRVLGRSNQSVCNTLTVLVDLGYIVRHETSISEGRSPAVRYRYTVARYGVQAG